MTWTAAKKEARKHGTHTTQQEWEEVYMLVVVLNEAWRALDMPPVLSPLDDGNVIWV